MRFLVPGLLGLAGALACPASEPDPAGLLPSVLAGTCSPGRATLAEVPEPLADAREVESSAVQIGGRDVGWRRRLETSAGDELLLVELAPGGRLHRFNAQYSARVAGRLVPLMMISLDGHCQTRAARRLVYSAQGEAVRIERLAGTLDRVEASEPLNPPVPSGSPGEGVPVAIVDAGVNYLLPAIGERLLRDEHGRALGYDFWDMDDRPFDANPARSVFFPQRHGTRTASLLLSEAPMALLLPYRYPRPDMSRMSALIENAAVNRARIVNVSMGSRHRHDWEAFQSAARAHPEMLFVVSAGNDGRDLDESPVFPATLRLENLIAVTSIDDAGRPAPGSNWGSSRVHLGVAAENVLVTDFHGRVQLASGSSYAAVRVSALAVCLLAANPDWRAPELKRAIFALATPAPFLLQGVLPEPDRLERGACPAARTAVEVKSTIRIERAQTESSRLELRPSLVLLEGTGWTAQELPSMIDRVAKILAPCRVDIPAFDQVVVAVPEPMKFYLEASARRLVRAVPVARPSIFLVQDTLQPMRFDAEAIGRSNSRTRPELADTIWLTRSASPPGVSLAHELVHVLSDSAEHTSGAVNLMRETVDERTFELDAGQCRRLVEVGLRNGLLRSQLGVGAVEKPG